MPISLLGMSHVLSEIKKRITAERKSRDLNKDLPIQTSLFKNRSKSRPQKQEIRIDKKGEEQPDAFKIIPKYEPNVLKQLSDYNMMVESSQIKEQNGMLTAKNSIESKDLLSQVSFNNRIQKN